jgi:phosphatidylinositol-3-phosphatase
VTVRRRGPLALALWSMSAALAALSTVSGAGAGRAGAQEVPVCGAPAAHPVRYQSVVVFAFENRTWSGVGGPGFAGKDMPYLRALAEQCAWFTDWAEADRAQNSLSQYVAQVTGAPQRTTVDDCGPSARCSTTADSIFRQVRRSGRQAVNYVEGAVKPCSAAGNAPRHVPVLYLWGADDRARCAQQVLPLNRLDTKRLPAFAFVTPTLCHGGHDCDNATVDRWAAAHIQPVLDSPAYRRGKVAVFVWYDEDRPVPNLWISQTAAAGAHTVAGAGYAGTLKAWQQMLGVPCLANACTAPDMRRAANT